MALIQKAPATVRGRYIVGCLHSQDWLCHNCTRSALGPTDHADALRRARRRLRLLLLWMLFCAFPLRSGLRWLARGGRLFADFLSWRLRRSFLAWRRDVSPSG